MPAQWPIFITNLTNKLVSSNSTGPEDIGQFVAQEYFNAVSTSQTIFGNIHTPGQKIILDAGFKKAFRGLMESDAPVLLDKFNNPPYDDMFEEFPEVDLSFDPLCEIEKWTDENKDTINPFLFYQFYPSTCPVPGEEDKPTNLFGDIEVNEDTLNGLDLNTLEGEPEVTMKVTGGDGVPPYVITYRLNGKILKTTADSQGVSKIKVPSEVGEYSYTFLSAIDSTGDIELINVNKGAQIRIEEGESGVTVTSTKNPPRKLIPEELDDYSTRVIETAKRVWAQNDGTFKYRKWLGTIHINKNTDFIRAVAGQVVKWYDAGTTFPMVLNRRVFQDEHRDFKDQIPSWLTKDIICRFTYDTATNRYRNRRDKESRSAYIRYLKNSDAVAHAAKEVKYHNERITWGALKKRWVTELSDSQKTGEDNTEGDEYEIMAASVIKYWQSTASAPFTAAPPIPPCNIPAPGQFVPVSYGNKKRLANDLRMAWNTGKQFDVPPSLQTAATAVSTAVAVAFAKHLKDIKYIYIGQLYVGVTTIPMIGFSPTTF